MRYFYACNIAYTPRMQDTWRMRYFVNVIILFEFYYFLLLCSPAWRRCDVRPSMPVIRTWPTTVCEASASPPMASAIWAIPWGKFLKPWYFCQPFIILLFVFSWNRSRRSRSINSVTSTGTSNSGVDRHNRWVQWFNAQRSMFKCSVFKCSVFGEQKWLAGNKLFMKWQFTWRQQCETCGIFASI